MSTAARLAAFAAMLIAVLGAGVGIGAAVGPDPTEPRDAPIESEGPACDPTHAAEGAENADMDHGSS